MVKRNSLGKFIKGTDAINPFPKGHISWMKGKVFVPIENCLSCGKKFKAYNNSKGVKKRFCSKRCSKLNNYNPQYKGENASYGPIHAWVKARKPKPDYCEWCKEKKPLDLANISQQYKRDINDFEWLCRKCHIKQDGRNLRYA